MSRSEYSDDCENNWSLICWRGAVASAIKGNRGQAFLTELIAALDALPEKKLIADELEQEGAVCAIGAVGKARGIDMKGLDPENSERVASVFGIAPAMAREIVYENDERGSYKQTPEERWARMRRWAVDEIWAARGCVANPSGKHKSVRMMSFPYWRTVIDETET